MSQSAEIRSITKTKCPGTRPDEAALDYPDANPDKLRHQGTLALGPRAEAPEGGGPDIARLIYIYL